MGTESVAPRWKVGLTARDRSDGSAPDAGKEKPKRQNPSTAPPGEEVFIFCSEKHTATGPCVSMVQITDNFDTN